MAAKEEKSSDFYEVLGLKKECSDEELRNAYKKLALKWHPDRCSSSGNSKHIEEAKMKFQSIQEAYSVLKDENKRFLYDVGVYDCDDDNDENGMGDFLNEMATMMSQNKLNDSREESFENLQELFEEMFQSDIPAFNSSSRSGSAACSTSSLYTSCSESYNSTNKRNSSEISTGNFETNASLFEGFCLGAEHQGSSRRGRGGREVGGRTPGKAGSGRRGGRKQKVSPGLDVSSDH